MLRDSESQVFVDDCFRGHDAGYLTLNVLQSISTSYPSRWVGNTVNRQLPWLITDLKSSIHSKHIITLPSLLLLRIPICSFIATAVREERKDLWGFFSWIKARSMGWEHAVCRPDPTLVLLTILADVLCSSLQLLSLQRRDFLSGSFSWYF